MTEFEGALRRAATRNGEVKAAVVAGVTGAVMPDGRAVTPYTIGDLMAENREVLEDTFGGEPC